MTSSRTIPDISNNTMNRVASGDEAVHDWYRFVLSFPPHLVRHYLDRWNLDSSHRVLDPFCGTGTTLVECKKGGVSSVGIEAHPMTHLAANAKTNWSVDADAMLVHSTEVAQDASERLCKDGVPDTPDTLFTPGQMPDQAESNRLKTLPMERFKLILKNSISPRPLHKALVLLDVLETRRDVHFREHQRLALAYTLVNKASNLHFGPEVGVGRIKQDAPVIEPWLTAMQRIIDDLRSVQNQKKVSAAAHHADARQLPDMIADESVDAVITSPPYPNEKDYTRTTRLETVTLGMARDLKEMRNLKRGLVRSNTRGVYKSDDDDQWITQFPEIEELAQRIEARRIELGKTSGFERMYARVTRLYFGGMARHLAELRPVLRPEARLAYVVGDQASYLQVMIRTGQLLGRIAETLGYELLDIDLFRTRLATATGEQLREEVVLLRWPG